MVQTSISLQDYFLYYRDLEAFYDGIDPVISRVLHPFFDSIFTLAHMCIDSCFLLLLLVGFAFCLWVFLEILPALILPF